MAERMHARLLDEEPVPPAHLGEWKHCCDDPEFDCFDLHNETHLSFVLQGAFGLIESARQSFPLGVLLLTIFVETRETHPLVALQASGTPTLRRTMIRKRFPQSMLAIVMVPSPSQESGFAV
jgi:hypothetical protein